LTEATLCSTFFLFVFICNTCSQTWYCSLHRAYDRAAIKFRGVEADINFSLSDYEEDLKQVLNRNIRYGNQFIWILCHNLIHDNLIGMQMRGLSKEEFVLLLRRQINGSSRSSTYKGALALRKDAQGEPRRAPFIGKTWELLFQAFMPCSNFIHIWLIYIESPNKW